MAFGALIKLKRAQLISPEQLENQFFLSRVLMKIFLAGRLHWTLSKLLHYDQIITTASSLNSLSISQTCVSFLCSRESLCSKIIIFYLTLDKSGIRKERINDFTMYYLRLAKFYAFKVSQIILA